MIISYRSNRKLVYKGWVITFCPKNQLVSDPGLVGGLWSKKLPRIWAVYILLIFPFKSDAFTVGQKYVATIMCFQQLDEGRGKERSSPFSWINVSGIAYIVSHILAKILSHGHAAKEAGKWSLYLCADLKSRGSISIGKRERMDVEDD